MRKTNKSEIFADEEEDKSAHEIEAMRGRAAMPRDNVKSRKLSISIKAI